MKEYYVRHHPANQPGGRYEIRARANGKDLPFFSSRFASTRQDANAIIAQLKRDDEGSKDAAQQWTRDMGLEGVEMGTKSIPDPRTHEPELSRAALEYDDQVAEDIMNMEAGNTTSREESLAQMETAQREAELTGQADRADELSKRIAAERRYLRFHRGK